MHPLPLFSKKKFAFLICVFSFLNSQAQLDSVFWFVAPEVAQHNNPYSFDRPIQLNIASFSSTPVNVSVSQPANNAFVPILNVIPANGYLTVDLTPYITQIENKPENTVLPYGLLIKTSDLVNIYYEIAMGGVNPETYALKGKNALGTDFMIPGQNEYANGGSYIPTPLNRIDIVATENNTRVWITPSQSMSGHPAGVTFPVDLNRGETYCCTATGITAANHLQGTVITSNNPIAVTVTDDLLNCPGGGQDLIGDQIVPLSIIGQEYIAVKGSLYPGHDKVYILGTVDNTSIFANGNTAPAAIVNKGQTFVLEYSQGDAVHFTSSQPVYAFQLTGMGVEFGGALLPPIRCTGSEHIKYKKGTGATLKLNICVPAGGESGFLLNGSPAIITAADFLPVPGTNNTWLYTSKTISSAIIPDNSLLSLSNTVNFHAGVFEGGTTGGCSYGFFSGYGASNNLLPGSNHTGRGHVFCEGDSMRLFLQETDGFYDIRWETPDGSVVDAPEMTIPRITAQQAGTYTVTASTTTNCAVLPATIDITVIPPPAVDLGNDIHECQDSYMLDAIIPSVTYLWSTGETTRQITATQSGNYWVEVSNPGCSRRDTVSLFLNSIVPTEIRQTGTLCENGVVQLSVVANGGTITWSTGESTNIIATHLPGEYWVLIDKNGCISSDTLFIEPGFKPSLEIIRHGDICQDSQVLLEALSDASGIVWSTGDTTSSITVTRPGYYSVQAADFECYTREEITITCPCELWIPNCFTPNGDDYNATFAPVSTNIIENYTLYIYNRWGNLVFKSNNFYHGWDGTCNGSYVPTGTYFYVMEYTCFGSGKIFTNHGSVTLIR